MNIETPLESVTSRPKLRREPRPNHQVVLRAYRAMTPEQKLQEVFKLNERLAMLAKAGLRMRYPELDDAALHKAYLRVRDRCHNRNY